MSEPTHSPARSEKPFDLGHHLRRRMISGILVLLPLGITYVILKLFFKVTAGSLVPVLDKHLHWPHWLINSVSILVFILVIYAAGTIATRMLGRRLIAFGENVILRVPILKSIYAASKQVVGTFSAQNESAFKNVILVDFPRKGVKCLAFGTGMIKDGSGRDCYKVFLPTSPNPTTGFFLIMPPEDVQTTSMSVEDGIKMIVSGGIISPDSLQCTGTPDIVCEAKAESNLV